MRKFILAVALMLAATAAHAIPQKLYADPYPSTGVVPDAASFTVDGGSALACSLVAVTGGLQPQCPLTSINAPGTYILVMTVTKAGSVTNGTNTGTVTTTGSASSANFTFVLKIGNATPPTLSVQ